MQLDAVAGSPLFKPVSWFPARASLVLLTADSSGNVNPSEGDRRHVSLGEQRTRLLPKNLALRRMAPPRPVRGHGFPCARRLETRRGLCRQCADEYRGGHPRNCLVGGVLLRHRGAPPAPRRVAGRRRDGGG